VVSLAPLDIYVTVTRGIGVYLAIVYTIDDDKWRGLEQSPDRSLPFLIAQPCSAYIATV
jgi:hypothetical protein